MREGFATMEEGEGGDVPPKKLGGGQNALNELALGDLASSMDKEEEEAR